MNAHYSLRHGVDRRASRRNPRAAMARLAAFVTVTAAIVAWLLASVAELSERAVVVSVMAMAFIASWVVTAPRATTNHRVTVVRPRARVR